MPKKALKLQLLCMFATQPTQACMLGQLEVSGWYQACLEVYAKCGYLLESSFENFHVSSIQIFHLLYICILVSLNFMKSMYGPALLELKFSCIIAIVSIPTNVQVSQDLAIFSCSQHRYLYSNNNSRFLFTDSSAGEKLSQRNFSLNNSTYLCIAYVSVIYQNPLNDRLIGLQNECIGEADGEDGLKNVFNSPHTLTPFQLVVELLTVIPKQSMLLQEAASCHQQNLLTGRVQPICTGKCLLIDYFDLYLTESLWILSSAQSKGSSMLLMAKSSVFWR